MRWSGTRSWEEQGAPIMNKAVEPIPKLEGYNCFACGTKNPIGLKLQFYVVEEYVCSDIRLDKNYEGWENMAHGGIVSTLLDEVMSWALIYFKKILFVTRSMRIKYIKPVPLYALLTIKARVMAERKDRLYEVSGFIQDQADHILARGEARFARLSDKELHLVPEKLKRDMENLFERF